MRRKTLLNRNVIIVLMLFIFLMTAFVSTAYSFWYFPDESLKTVNTDMKVDDIEENFKNKDTYGSYLKIIDCRDGVIPNDTDFAKSESGFLDNSENFTDKGNTFRGKKNSENNYNYSKKVFGVSSSAVNELYKYPFKGEYALGSFVSSVFYRSGTSVTGSGTSVTGSDTSMIEIYLYDLLNSQYKLVDHLTNESIELIDRNVTSSDGGDKDKSYSSTKSEDYRKNIGYSFSKSRILFLVPRDTNWINNKQPETPKKVSNYNIYFHSDFASHSDLDYVWLWNDRTDFGVSLRLNCSDTIADKSYKSLHIDYRTLYKAWNCDNSFKDTNEAGFIMTPKTAPTGIIFKTKDGTNLAPKDTDNGKTEYLALPLPPKNSTSFDIYINADKDNGKFTISTDQDVDLTKNKNIVYYSTSSTSSTNVLDHLWMWSTDTSAPSVWISSNYVYKFNMADCNKTVSCFSYNYGEKFNFYKNWKGPNGTAQFSPGFTFDKNYNYNQLKLVNYNGDSETGTIDISGLFNNTSDECTSVYLIEDNKNNNGVTVCSSKTEFIEKVNKLN